MRLPRDLSGSDLAARLSVLGYMITRQTGSHMRVTTQSNGEHHVTIPAHDPIKIGTLNSILRAVERHHGLRREELLAMLQ
jgi:predicted RNA binding protein YcfA (HicA-like mRNA interferase family)